MTTAPPLQTLLQTPLQTPLQRQPLPPVATHARDSDWTSRAACSDVDPDELFVTGAEQNKVKTRCTGCPVRTECLADALDNRVEFGVWGGMTERERRALLRRRPDVTSWATLLFSARAEALAPVRRVG